MKKLIFPLLLAAVILLATACTGTKPAQEETTAEIAESTSSEIKTPGGLKKNDTESTETDTEASAEETTAEVTTAEGTTAEQKTAEPLKLTVYQFPGTPEYEALKVTKDLGDTGWGKTEVRVVPSCDCKISLYKIDYNIDYNFARRESEFASADVKAGECVSFICEPAETIPYYCLTAETEDNQLCEWLVTYYGKDAEPFDVDVKTMSLDKDDLIIRIAGIYASYASDSDKDLNDRDDIFWTLIHNSLTAVHCPDLEPMEDETIEASWAEVFGLEQALFTKRNGEPAISDDYGISYNPETDTYTSEASTLMFVCYEATNIVLNSDETARVDYHIADTDKDISVILKWEPGTLLGWSVQDTIK